MDISSITGLVGIGIIAACWRQVSSSASRLRSLFVVRVEVEDQLVGHVLAHCWKNFRRSPFGDRRYTSFGAFVRPVGRHIQIAVERPPTQPLLLWQGWKPLMLSAGKQSGFNGGLPDNNGLTLAFLRWSFDADLLLVGAVDAANKSAAGNDVAGAQRRFRVSRLVGRDRNVIMQAGHNGGGVAPEPCKPPGDTNGQFITDRLLKWQPSEVGPADPDDPMEPLAFPPEVEGLIQEITRWKASEKWFRSKRIPWRRGWLLYGRPGTGKTSLVRASAQLIDVPVYVYDLATLSNSELVGAWKEMLANTPCIALMEDMDTIFDGRKNVARPDDGLTFDCLLNCIGGVEEADGIFTVVTTNDVSKIDPALGNPTAGEISTRPGRLDRAVELKGLTKECRLRIAQRILADDPEEVVGVVLDGDGDTGAQFQERCAQIALRRYWQTAA